MATSTDISQRSNPVDFAKGALVILMILYHWLNYFVTPVGEFYRYLRFVTPGFIFITGFLISNVLTAKYQSRDAGLYMRLLQRGLRLLLLFTLLNLLANFVKPAYHHRMELGLSTFYNNLYTIYIEGNDHAAVFSVLVPIAYLLMASPLILQASAASRYPLSLLASIMFIVTIALNTTHISGQIMDLMGFGFLGIAIGGLSAARLHKFVRQPALIWGFYLVTLVGLTVWNVVYLMQAASVCANLSLFYWIGDKIRAENNFSQIVVKFGRYTLFVYIFHILLLQAMRGILHTSTYSPAAIVLPLVLTLLFSLTAITLIAHARSRSADFDRVYRLTFA